MIKNNNINNNNNKTITMTTTTTMHHLLLIWFWPKSKFRFLWPTITTKTTPPTTTKTTTATTITTTTTTTFLGCDSIEINLVLIYLSQNHCKFYLSKIVKLKIDKLSFNFQPSWVSPIPSWSSHPSTPTRESFQL